VFSAVAILNCQAAATATISGLLNLELFQLLAANCLLLSAYSILYAFIAPLRFIFRWSISGFGLRFIDSLITATHLFIR
jgi:hypothetical protein